MKKLTAIFLLIIMIQTISVFADENSKILIEFDKEQVTAGDYFEAVVKVENVSAEYIVVPVHFNPRVVKVADKNGELVLSGVKTASEARDGSIGLTPLEALSSETDEGGQPKYWNGAIFENPAYPEIDNENGFVRLMLSNVKTKEIISEALISIKFVALSEGNADIRFATSYDELYDITAENGAKYIQENVENPMEAAISNDFSNVVTPGLVVSPGGSITPPPVQPPSSGGNSGGGTTSTFSPPPALNDILTVEFTENEIINLLPRAADETQNSLNIKIEASDTVTKIIIKIPASVIETALSAWVFTTEFDTPLGKIGFDNQEIAEEITKNSKYVICAITKGNKEITIEEKSAAELLERIFSDLPKDHWAYDYVMTLVSGGYLDGVSETEFAPEDNVTREQFAKMLVSARNVYNEDMECDFTDVERDHWAYSYIASAVNAGIISGYEDGTFGLGKNITRQEMAVMVARAKPNLPERISAITFKDSDEISDWAALAVTKVQKADIINGMPDGSFSPKADATRSQAAKIIYCLVIMS